MRVEDRIKVQKLYRQKRKQKKEEKTLDRDLLVVIVIVFLLLLHEMLNLPFDVDVTIVKLQMAG